MPLNRLFSFSLLSPLLISLTGCIGGSTPPSQFYLLEPIHDIANGASRDQSKMLVALAPVRIPKYIDRPQIVNAIAPNVYQLNELNRWAEALDENISRILVQNLSLLVPTEVLPTNTSNLARQAKYRLSVNILEFHVDPQGQAGLTVQWHVTQGENRLLAGRCLTKRLLRSPIMELWWRLSMNV